MDPSVASPYGVLGVSVDATPDEVRRNYLNLVRQHPPDRDADTFRQIHTAYTMLSDPLVQADAIMTAMHRDQPDLATIVMDAAKERCRLPFLFLLALGNQEDLSHE